VRQSKEREKHDSCFVAEWGFEQRLLRLGFEECYYISIVMLVKSNEGKGGVN